MEAKINIAAILKDKPQGTKLYSSACGKCELKEADDKSFKISFYSSKSGFMNGGEGTFDKNGNLYDDGECIVFPSKEMRDWRKFLWKKGDVLATEDGSTKVIFECFEDDTYLTFKGKYCLQETNIDETFIVDTKKNLTEYYSLQAKNIAQIYIHNIEDRIGGMLNMETLGIEKSLPEFKDGDIVTATSDFGSIFIGILKKSIKDFPNKELRFYCALENSEQLAFGGLELILKAIKTSFATDEEKKQLFDALAKEGKAWDADKKMIVVLKPKIELKPFDKVLVRDCSTRKWEAELFGFKSDTGRYHCVGGTWNQCIPYEGNEHLLGTTKDVEG